MDNYRHEYKYLINYAQMAVIENRIKEVMTPDIHALNGSYNISSLYFDDYDNTCYYENEDGKDPREKFRIRIYNHDTNHIVLECKRKERGKTYKSSCLLSIDEYNGILNNTLKISEKNNPLLNKLLLQMNIRMLMPVVIVDYIRIPYIEENGNVRITFDTHLTSSNEIDHFLNGDYTKRAVYDSDSLILEVKWDDFIPDYIYNAIQIDNLMQTNNSKYYLCRQFNI